MKTFQKLSIENLDGIRNLPRRGATWKPNLPKSVRLHSTSKMWQLPMTASPILLQSASAMFQYGVAKLNIANDTVDLSALKTIIDRVKFMKMGQQAMSSDPGLASAVRDMSL